MQVNEEIIRYYTRTGEEINRLNTGSCQLEKTRTQKIIARYLPEKPVRILDVGGAAGAYSFWLSGMGHSVHLIDPVPLHIETARKLSAQAAAPLASINTGEARELIFPDEYFDIVLLMGPLYHLTGREDRIAALREAKRVVRPGGLVFCALISRFAALLDEFFRGAVNDPAAAEAIKSITRNGQLRNEKEKPGNFVTAYCHKPTELEAEAAEAGLCTGRVFAIESFGWLLPYFDHKWRNNAYRETLLSLIELVESESSLLGMSAHYLAVVRKTEAYTDGAGI